MNKSHNIFLIGLMGSGKTTIGKYLAKKLAMDFYDSDSEIEVRAGANIAWIFDLEGEAGFRKREVQVIAELTQKENIVLATGGGVVLDSANRMLLAAHGTVIYLQASNDQLLARTRSSRTRPLLLKDDPQQVFIQLQKQREPLYREIANLVYNTNDFPVNKLGDKIIADLLQLG